MANYARKDNENINNRYLFMMWDVFTSGMAIPATSVAAQWSIPPLEAAGMKDKKDMITASIVISSYTGAPIQQILNVGIKAWEAKTGRSFFEAEEGNGYVFEPFTEEAMQEAMLDASARIYAYKYYREGKVKQRLTDLRDVKQYPNQQWAKAVIGYLESNPTGVLEIMENATRMLPMVDSRTAAHKFAAVYASMMGETIDLSIYDQAKPLKAIMEEYIGNFPMLQTAVGNNVSKDILMTWVSAGSSKNLDNTDDPRTKLLGKFAELADGMNQVGSASVKKTKAILTYLGYKDIANYLQVLKNNNNIRVAPECIDEVFWINSVVDVDEENEDGADVIYISQKVSDIEHPEHILALASAAATLYYVRSKGVDIEKAQEKAQEVLNRIKNKKEWVKRARVYYAFLRNAVRRERNEKDGFGNFTDLRALIDHAKDLGFNILFAMPLNDPVHNLTPQEEDSPYSIFSLFALDPRSIDWDETGVKGATLWERWDDFSKNEKFAQAFAEFIRDENIMQYAYVKTARVIEKQTKGYWHDDFAGYEQLDGKKKKEVFDQVRNFVFMEQYLAREQLLGAIDYGYEQGVIIWTDMPFFNAMEGVAAAFNPSVLRQDENGRIKAAGHAIGTYGQQLWGDEELQQGLADSNWEGLQEQDYKRLIDPIRFMLEKLGLLGERLDAFHYGFGMPLFKEMVAKLFKSLGGLAVPEALGALNEGEVNKVLIDLEMFPIITAAGPGRPWHDGNIHNYVDRLRVFTDYVFGSMGWMPGMWMLTHHDAPRISHSFGMLFPADVSVVARTKFLYTLCALGFANYSLLMGDEFAVEEQINRPGQPGLWKQSSPFYRDDQGLLEFIRGLNRNRDKFDYLCEFGNVRNYWVDDSGLHFERVSKNGAKVLKVFIETRTGEYTVTEETRSTYPASFPAKPREATVAELTNLNKYIERVISIAGTDLIAFADETKTGRISDVATDISKITLQKGLATRAPPYGDTIESQSFQILIDDIIHHELAELETDSHIESIKASIDYFRSNIDELKLYFKALDDCGIMIDADYRKQLNDVISGSVSDSIIFKENISFDISEDYAKRLNETAYNLLPYTTLLVAVNILLKYEKSAGINKIEVDFKARHDSVFVREGVLYIRVVKVKSANLETILEKFSKGLGWDFEKTINSFGYDKSYLMLDSNNFAAINVIIHSRMAGLGDLVFVVNTAQVLRLAFPDKVIRLVFHKEEDFNLVCTTKILKGLDPEKSDQIAENIYVVNAERYGIEHYGVPEKTMWPSMETQPWYRTQKDIFNKNDVSIIYALGGTEKDIHQNSQAIREYAGPVDSYIKVFEVGFEAMSQNPIAHGSAHLGFNEDAVGLPPVSPVGKTIYGSKYPRDRGRIHVERARIIKKFPGWQVLNKALGQTNLERTVASEWGFMYAHEARSAEKYLGIFERARKKYADFGEGDKTIFVMTSRGNKALHEKVYEIVEENDYSLFRFNEEGKVLELVRASKDGKVTVVLDYSVPRKLFSELMLYSDDLPSMVSGQDNLANVLYLNHLGSGRPFFWEVLIFQGTAEIDLKILAEKKLGKEAADRLRESWNMYDQSERQEDMFAHPRLHRIFFKELSSAVSRDKHFVSQIYYMMLREREKAGWGTGRKRAEKLVQDIREAKDKNVDLSGSGESDLTRGEVDYFIEKSLRNEPEHRVLDDSSEAAILARTFFGVGKNEMTSLIASLYSRIAIPLSRVSLEIHVLETLPYRGTWQVIEEDGETILKIFVKDRSIGLNDVVVHEIAAAITATFKDPKRGDLRPTSHNTNLEIESHYGFWLHKGGDYLHYFAANTFAAIEEQERKDSIERALIEILGLEKGEIDLTGSNHHSRIVLNNSKNRGFTYIGIIAVLAGIFTAAFAFAGDIVFLGTIDYTDKASNEVIIKFITAATVVYFIARIAEGIKNKIVSFIKQKKGIRSEVAEARFLTRDTLLEEHSDRLYRQLDELREGLGQIVESDYLTFDEINERIIEYVIENHRHLQWWSLAKDEILSAKRDARKNIRLRTSENNKPNDLHRAKENNKLPKTKVLRRIAIALEIRSNKKITKGEKAYYENAIDQAIVYASRDEIVVEQFSGMKLMEIRAGPMPNLWGVVRSKKLNLNNSLFDPANITELVLTLLHEASLLAYPERTCEENEQFAIDSIYTNHSQKEVSISLKKDGNKNNSGRKGSVLLSKLKYIVSSFPKKVIKGFVSKVILFVLNFERSNASVLVSSILRGMLFTMVYHMNFIRHFIKHKKGIEDIAMSFGYIPKRIRSQLQKHPKTILFCVMGVGEVLNSMQLLKKLEAEFPEYNKVFLSVNNRDISDMAVVKESNAIIMRYPLNSRFILRNWIKKIQPAMVIVQENFRIAGPKFFEIAKKECGANIILINWYLMKYKLSEAKDVLQGIYDQEIYRSYDHLAVETNEGRDYFISQGVNENSVSVLGNMKFDTSLVDFTEQKKDRILKDLRLQPDEPVLVYGSVHEEEVQILFDAYKDLLRVPGLEHLKLIFAPQNLAQVRLFLTFIKAQGFDVIKKSELSSIKEGSVLPDILLLDTYGELKEIYSVATVVVVAGSMVSKHGGHNPIEPANFARPIVVGPHMENFAYVANAFIENNGIVQLKHAEDLSLELTRLFNDRKLREELGQKALEVSKNHRGILDGYFRLIRNYLNSFAHGLDQAQNAKYQGAHEIGRRFVQFITFGLLRKTSKRFLDIFFTPFIGIFEFYKKDFIDKCNPSEAQRPVMAKGIQWIYWISIAGFVAAGLLSAFGVFLTKSTILLHLIFIPLVLQIVSRSIFNLTHKDATLTITNHQYIHDSELSRLIIASILSIGVIVAGIWTLINPSMFINVDTLLYIPKVQITTDMAKNILFILVLNMIATSFAYFTFVLSEYFRRMMSGYYRLHKNLENILIYVFDRTDKARRKAQVASHLILINSIVDWSFVNFMLKPFLLYSVHTFIKGELAYLSYAVVLFATGGIVRLLLYALIYKPICGKDISLSFSALALTFIPKGLGNFSPILYVQKKAKISSLVLAVQWYKLSKRIEAQLEGHTNATADQTYLMQKNSIKMVSLINHFRALNKEYNYMPFDVRGIKILSGDEMLSEKKILSIITPSRVSSWILVKSFIARKIAIVFNVLVDFAVVILFAPVQPGVKPLLLIGTKEDLLYAENLLKDNHLTKEQKQKIFKLEVSEFIAAVEDSNDRQVMDHTLIKPLLRLDSDEQSRTSKEGRQVTNNIGSQDGKSKDLHRAKDNNKFPRIQFLRRIAIAFEVRRNFKLSLAQRTYYAETIDKAAEYAATDPRIVKKLYAMKFMEVRAGLMPNIWGVVRGDVLHINKELLNKTSEIEFILTLLHEASLLTCPERTCEENERFARKSIKVNFHLHYVRESFKVAQQAEEGRAFSVETLDYYSDACYFLNQLLEDGQELLPVYMLEFNIITHVGYEWDGRGRYQSYVDFVEQRFNANIGNVWNWYKANRHQSPWYLAAGVYARIVGSPQLFEEGNHRTGILVASYILMREGYHPFVLSTENAEEFYDYSMRFKESKTGWPIIRNFVRGPSNRSVRRFADFLRRNASTKHIQLIRSDIDRDDNEQPLDPHRAKIEFCLSEEEIAQDITKSTIIKRKSRYFADAIVQAIELVGDRDDAVITALEKLKHAIEIRSGNYKKVWASYRHGILFIDKSLLLDVTLNKELLITLIHEARVIAYPRSLDKENEEFALEIVIDYRPVKAGLLNSSYVKADLAIKEEVNYSSDPITAVYIAAGADVSNFLLSVNAIKSYFISSYRGKFGWFDRMRARDLQKCFGVNSDLYIERYLDKYSYGEKFKDGFTSTQGVETKQKVIAAVAYELRSMGVDLSTVKVYLEDKRPAISFRWSYLREDEKTYTIVFVNADARKWYQYQEIFKNNYIDVVYQRAALMMPLEYKKGSESYIAKIYQYLKPGAYFVTDDCAFEFERDDFSEQHMWFPLALKVITNQWIDYMREEILKRHMKIYVQDGGILHYGWDVIIRQKSVDRIFAKHSLVEQKDILQDLRETAESLLTTKTIDISNLPKDFKVVAVKILALYERLYPTVKYHSLRVAKLADGIAQELGFNERERGLLMLASLAHDIGKNDTEEYFIGKGLAVTIQGLIMDRKLLSEEERFVVGRHATKSYKILYRSGALVNLNADEIVILRYLIALHHNGKPCNLKAYRQLSEYQQKSISKMLPVLIISDISDSIRDQTRPYILEREELSIEFVVESMLPNILEVECGNMAVVYAAVRKLYESKTKWFMDIMNETVAVREFYNSIHDEWMELLGSEFNAEDEEGKAEDPHRAKFGNPSEEEIQGDIAESRKLREKFIGFVGIVNQAIDAVGNRDDAIINALELIRDSIEIRAGYFKYIWGTFRSKKLYLDLSLLLDNSLRKELIITLIHEAGVIAYPENSDIDNENFAQECACDYRDATNKLADPLCSTPEKIKAIDSVLVSDVQEKSRSLSYLIPLLDDQEKEVRRKAEYAVALIVRTVLYSRLVHYVRNPLVSVGAYVRRIVKKMKASQGLEQLAIKIEEEIALSVDMVFETLVEGEEILALEEILAQDGTVDLIGSEANKVLRRVRALFALIEKAQECLKYIEKNEKYLIWIDTDEGKSCKSSMSVVQKEFAGMVKIFEAMRSFVEMQTIGYGKIEISQFVEQLERLLNSDNNIKTITRLDNTVNRKIRVPSVLSKDALDYFLENAKNSKADNIELELSEEGGMLRIVIRDNGSQNNTTERVPFLSVLQAGSDSGSTMLFVVNMLTAVRSVGGNIRVVTYEDAAFTREVIIDLPFINEREEFENDNGEEVKVDDIQAALRAIAQEIKEEALFSSPDFEDVQIAVLEGKNKIDNEFRYRLTLLNEALREYVLASIENAWAQTISIDFAVSEGGILEVRVVSDEKGIIYINQRNMVLGVKGKDVGRRLIDLRDRFREVGGDIVGELIGVNNVYTFRLPVTLVDKRVNQSVYVQPSHIINKLEQGKPNWLLRILLSFWVVPHELGNLALTMFVHSWRKNLQFNLKDIFAGLRYNNVAPSCIGGTVVNLMLGLFLALLFPGSLTALVLGLSQMIFAVIEMRMSETPPDVKAVNADIERIKKDYLDLHYARMDLAKINLIIEDEFNEFIKLVRSRIYWIATVFSVTEVLILLRYLDVLYSGAIGFVTFVLLTKLFKLRAFSNVRKMYKNEIAGYRSVIKNFKYSEQYILSAGVKDYNKEGETEHLSIVRIAGKNLVRVLIGSGPYDLTQGIFINIAEHISRTRIVSFWRLWLDEKNIVNIERAGQFIVERTNVSFHFAGVRIVVERVGDVLLVNDGGKFVQVEYVNMWGDKNQGTAKFNIPIDWHSIESESMFNVAKRDDLNKAIAARFKKLGAMLKVLEDYLRKMQRTRGSPVVAERIGEDIVWHLTEQQITSILSSADHSQEDIAFLIDQIKIHEAEPTEEAAINAQIESLVITEINEIDNPIRKMDDYESLIQLLGKIAKTSQGMELLRDICIETQIFKMRTVAIDALIEIGNRIEVDKIKELFFELLEECGHPYSIKRLLVFIINNYGKSAIQQLEDIRQRSDDDNKQKTIKLALFNLENMKPEVEDAEDSFTDFVGRIDNSRPEKRQRLQILDVATGAAGFVREIQRHFWGRNARITAIDGSQGMVENALVLSFIEVLFMNWGKMEFTDESFDLITYNFPSPNAGLGSVAVAFKEIFRVCRYGGGLAFYSTEDEFNGFNSVQIIGKLEKSGFERKNINIYRGDQIPASYPRAGTSAQITKPHEAKQI
ncbi:MAG: 4-alpha-glucanotransferase [Candidatus Omnitrophica bacterium]|nr:4-alpha-glucanotransferase [Candidatus Omnitrophota bacterium]